MAVLGVVSRVSYARVGDEWRYTKRLDATHIESLCPSWTEVRVCANGVVLHADYQTAWDSCAFHEGCLARPHLFIRHSGAPGSAALAYLRMFSGMDAWVRTCDAVYAFMPGWIGAIGAALALRRGKPLGVYLGGDWRETGKHNPRLQGPSFARAAAARLYSAAAGAIQSGIVRRAQVVLVHGPALYARYERLDRPGHRVCRVAPVLGFSEADVHVREDTCQGDRVRLLDVGELLPVKGVEVLLRACASLAGGSKTFSLRIAGEGPDRAKLAALTDRLGLRDRVSFEGYVPHGDALWRLYRESDAFVLPSLSEGFPRVIYEAMSQGLPVVASSAGGIAAELAGGVDALLVPPGDDRALAAGIAALPADPDLRRRLIHNGYGRTARLFERMRSESPAALLDRYLKPLA